MNGVRQPSPVPGSTKTSTLPRGQDRELLVRLQVVRRCLPYSTYTETATDMEVIELKGLNSEVR